MQSLITALAIIVVPGTVCFLVPYFILTNKHISLARSIAIPQIGALLIIALGLYMILWVGVAFVSRGRGTPVPIDPPTRLVINGLYRYVRNPMYTGAVLIVLGEAAYYGTWYLVLYAVALWAVLHTQLLVIEEPQLKERFGKDYERYLTEVPRWIPRTGKNRMLKG